MASLFTNVSAMTALQTLTSVSKNLADTQTRISTGLRINDASDNAAYWSIATTLRSDVGALGAVGDALGLGASTVDTVYTGLDNAKNLLTQIKEKLVTATTPGIPRAQVQAEITELQNRLKDGSSSTVINSESWLTQDSTAAGYNAIKSVVGSFTRASGTVTIDTINIDISKTKLYENSVTAQADVTSAVGTSAAASPMKTYFDALTAIADVTGATDKAWGTTLEKAATTTAGSAGQVIVPTAGRPATVAAASALTGAQLTTFDGTVTTLNAAAVNTALANFATDFTAGGADFIANLSTAQKTKLLDELNGYSADLTKSLSDVSAAHLAANGGVQATADAAALGGELGAKVISAVKDMETNVLAAFTKVVGTTARDAFIAKVGGDARAEFTQTLAANTANQKLGIFDKVRSVVSTEDGTGAQAISVANIDISKLTDSEFDRGIMQAYVKAVDGALQELTLSASVLGASKARIEGNQTFVKALVDANNRGIGQLVDADLNEESTRLKALQTQQQLAVQSLSIANSSSDSILQLFR